MWLGRRQWHVCVGLGVALSASGCFGIGKEEARAVACSPDPVVNPAFSIQGTIRYQDVKVLDTAVPPRLDYGQIEAKLARRVTVQALDNCGDVVVETQTLDDGSFTLSVPGNTISLAVAAHLKASSFSGTPCTGASWDVRIVDNTKSKAVWQYLTGLSFSSDAQAGVVTIPIAHNGTVYTDRSSAPFAMADTIVSAMDQVCQGTPATQFPVVYVNWSPKNQTASGDKTLGQITTSHFTVESWRGQLFPQLYILGKENDDTDEFDDAVVAHEFGHYVENSLYRSDTLGGSHSLSDMLDPRVAFGEGFGNAFQAMTNGNPLYVDTALEAQSSGFSFSVNTAPSSSNSHRHKGIHSETAVQWLLWRLYDLRDSAANSGNYGRIDNVLRNYQKSSPALTSLLTFAAYYNDLYGDSDSHDGSQGLRDLWSNAGLVAGNLRLAYDALCVGACDGSGGGGNASASSDVADPFDSDGDLGAAMELDGRIYNVSNPTGGSSPLVRLAEFWNPYRLLVAGTNPATAHDTIDAGHHSVNSYLYNKLGYVRWYRYTHNPALPAGGVRMDVVLGGGKSCSIDYTDMVVYHEGQIISTDYGFGGCPSVLFFAEPGEDYVITVDGVQLGSSGGVPSFSLTVDL
jgi:hypothetical protein